MTNFLSKFSEKTDFAKKQAEYLATHPSVSVVNGKEAYFLSVKEPPRRAFFVPIIFDRDHDLPFFPMHNYVQIIKNEDGKAVTSHMTYMCRGYVGKDCPICADGNRPSKRAYFKAIVCVGKDEGVELYKDKDGAYRLEYVEMGLKMSTELCTKALKDDRSFLGTVFDYSASGEGKDTTYDLDVKEVLKKVEMDGDKVPDLDYAALEMGINKYPTLEDYVEDMTSDLHYATYIPTPKAK